jgi:hypothetical protein
VLVGSEARKKKKGPFCPVLAGNKEKELCVDQN